MHSGLVPPLITHIRWGRRLGIAAVLGLASQFFLPDPYCLLPDAFFARATGLHVAASLPVFVFCCMIGAVAPDVLEPSTTRGGTHRGFFHSIVAAALLVVAGGALLLGETLDGRSVQSFFLRVGLLGLALGWLSHLLLDLTTPARLPWLTGRKIRLPRFLRRK